MRRLRATAWAIWPGASRPPFYPVLNPSARRDAEAAVVSTERARPQTVAMGRRVTESGGRRASAEEDVGVAVTTGDSRLRTVLPKNGLPNPAVARRLTRSARLDDAACDTRERRHAGAEVGWLVWVGVRSPWLIGSVEAARHAAQLAAATFLKGPEHRPTAGQTPDLGRDVLLERSQRRLAGRPEGGVDASTAPHEQTAGVRHPAVEEVAAAGPTRAPSADGATNGGGAEGGRVTTSAEVALVGRAQRPANDAGVASGAAARDSRGEAVVAVVRRHASAPRPQPGEPTALPVPTAVAVHDMEATGVAATYHRP